MAQEDPDKQSPREGAPAPHVPLEETLARAAARLADDGKPARPATHNRPPATAPSRRPPRAAPTGRDLRQPPAQAAAAAPQGPAAAPVRAPQQRSAPPPAPPTPPADPPPVRREYRGEAPRAPAPRVRPDQGAGDSPAPPTPRAAGPDDRVTASPAPPWSGALLVVAALAALGWGLGEWLLPAPATKAPVPAAAPARPSAPKAASAAKKGAAAPAPAVKRADPAPREAAPAGGGQAAREVTVVIKERATGKTPREVVHTVVEGDTLWTIAERYVHDPWAYRQLAEGNGIADPDRIQPGDQVRIVFTPGPARTK